MFERVESRFGFKQTFESQTPFFQEANIRFEVCHQFFLEIKHLILVSLLLMPPFKFLACFGGHGFGHVVVDCGDGSHVRLVFGDVELVGEVALLEFGQPKVLGKAERGIWKKLRESMKRMRSRLTSKSLHPLRSCFTVWLSAWYWWMTKYPSYPWKLWAMTLT